MADQTTNPEVDELSIESDSPTSDVDHDSTEQRETEESQQVSDVKIDSKFITKTNQNNADIRRFLAHIARGNSPQELIESDPELAKRLSRSSEMADLFVTDESDEEDIELKIQRAVDAKIGASERERRTNDVLKSFKVGGKYLNDQDIKILKADPTFANSLEGQTERGISPELAVKSAFTNYAEAHGKTELLKRVVSSGSVLASSSVTAESSKEESYLNAADKDFLSRRKNRHPKLNRPTKRKS